MCPLLLTSYITTISITYIYQHIQYSLHVILIPRITAFNSSQTYLNLEGMANINLVNLNQVKGNILLDILLVLIILLGTTGAPDCIVDGQALSSCAFSILVLSNNIILVSFSMIIIPSYTLGQDLSNRSSEKVWNVNQRVTEVFQ